MAQEPLIMTFRSFNLAMLFFGLILVILFCIKMITAMNGDDIFN